MAARSRSLPRHTGQRRPFQARTKLGWKWAPFCFWPPLFYFLISKELDMTASSTTPTVATVPETLAQASRRDFIKKGAATATFFSTLGHSGVWAAGSDAPEKTEVKIGFIPLTDFASVVMASVLGFDKKYGVKIIPSKEASWAGVRDKLVNGELDFAHVLYGLVYGVHMGTAGPKKDMAVLMSLNNNGQAITLSKALADKGAVDGPSLAKFMAAN